MLWKGLWNQAAEISGLDGPSLLCLLGEEGQVARLCMSNPKTHKRLKAQRKMTGLGRFI